MTPRPAAQARLPLRDRCAVDLLQAVLDGLAAPEGALEALRDAMGPAR